MVGLLRRVLRVLAYPVLFAWRHPRVSAGVAVVVLSGTLFGLWRYAVGEWKRAQVAVQEEKYQESDAPLDLCLKVWPNSTEVHLLAARVARHRGNLETAESHLNRCIELEKGATEQIQLEFLLLRAQTGEIDDLAKPLFKLVDEKHPDSREILDTITRVYSARLRYKLAYATLSKWIEVEPEYAKAYYWRGWVLERLNNSKAASVDYHKAIQLDPDMVPARLRVAEMLLEDKQAPEALPHLQRLMTQVPNDPQVQARMGICLFQRGEGAEARRLMERAVAMLPKDPVLHVTLANLDLQDGRAVEAEGHLRTVLANDPADTEALFVLVAALRAQGRTEEAEATLTEHTKMKGIVERINDLLKDRADNPTATADEYAEIGNLFADIRHDKHASYWLEQALVKDDRCQAAHRGLAAYYERKGEAGAAAFHRRQITSSLSPTAPPPTGKKP